MGIRGIVQSSWVESDLFDCDLRSCGELSRCLAAESSGNEVLVSDSRLIDHDLGIRYDLLACQQQQRQRLLCMAVEVCLKSI